MLVQFAPGEISLSPEFEEEKVLTMVSNMSSTMSLSQSSLFNPQLGMAGSLLVVMTHFLGLTSCSESSSEEGSSVCRERTFAERGFDIVDDVGDCPNRRDMSKVPGFQSCIDTWEASRGTNGEAVSVPGVFPWHSLIFAQAEQACLRAGKRLCREEEWVASCTAGGSTRWPYGNQFGAGRCADGSTGSHLLVPTGSHARCGSGPGQPYDLMGNVYEFIQATTGDGTPVGKNRIKGDMFFDTYNLELKDCYTVGYFNESKSVQSGGFRCCMDLEDKSAIE